MGGVTAEPMLVTPGADGILEAATDAKLIVAGLSLRYPPKGSELPIRRSSNAPRAVCSADLRFECAHERTDNGKNR
jgi:hypothetical protein